MTPGVNLVLQVATLMASALVRMQWGGWETFGFVMTGWGPLLLLVPTVLAAFLLGRRVLAWPLWVPFAGMAAGMLLACLLISAYPDTVEPLIPLFELLGLPGSRSEWAELTNPVGLAGMWSFPVFLVWALVAMTVFNKASSVRVEKAGA